MSEKMEEIEEWAKDLDEYYIPNVYLLMDAVKQLTKQLIASEGKSIFRAMRAAGLMDADVFELVAGEDK